MPPTPEGYPHALSDTELATAIADLAADLEDWPEEIHPQLMLALLSAGVNEQTRRELVKSSNIAKFALGVALLSLLVAIIAIVAQ